MIWINNNLKNLLPRKRKRIRWVVVTERSDVVLCTMSVPEIVGMVTVKKPTQSGSTWNVCNCRIYLQVDVEKITSEIIKADPSRCTSWKNYLQNYHIRVELCLYKLKFGNHISVTLYLLSCFLITFSVFSLQRGKLISCFPLQKSIVNTSCPARAATAQTQRGLPQQLPCLTCNCWCIFIIYVLIVLYIYLHGHKHSIKKYTRHWK